MDAVKDVAKKKRTRFFRKHRETISSYLIIAFPLLWWGVFFVFPLIRAFVMSFSNWSTFYEFEWIGFANYIEAFSDKVVRTAFKNTFLWSIVLLAGVNFFGLLLAFLLTNLKSKKASKVFLTLLFWPSLISSVVGATLQMALFGSEATGVVNWLLTKMHIIEKPIAWFQNPKIALYSLMIYPFFFGFGIKMLLYYVGIQNIPKNYYEAARLDTSSNLRTLWHITLPLLRPIIFLNVILSLIDGFKVIAPMQLIIAPIGGPENQTMSVVYKIYKDAFELQRNRLGYASAISFLLFFVILMVTVAQKWLEGKEVSYE